MAHTTRQAPLPEIFSGNEEKRKKERKKALSFLFATHNEYNVRIRSSVAFKFPHD